MDLPSPLFLSPQISGLGERLASKCDGHLPVILGLDQSGGPAIRDLAALPHLLIAGGSNDDLLQTLHGLLASMLCYATPDHCRLILIDPTGRELGLFEGLPHLLAPIASDPVRSLQLLGWLTHEMEARYEQLAAAKVRDIAAYAGKADVDPSLGALPRIVAVVSPYEDFGEEFGKEFESIVVRLAQKARHVGIHLLVGTRDPLAISATMRANLPVRVLLPVDTKAAARAVVGVIPQWPFLTAGELAWTEPKKKDVVTLSQFPVQADNLEHLAAHWRAQDRPRYLPESAFSPTEPTDPDGGDLFRRAVVLVAKHHKVSTPWLQRELRVSYDSAVEVIRQMEAHGFVSAPKAKTGRRVVTARGLELETDDEILETTTKFVPSEVIFGRFESRGYDPGFGRGTIKRKHTVEELVDLIAGSVPADDEGRAEFLTALRQGISERFPEAKPGLSDGPTLPTEAPETYQGLRGPETPPAFVQRVYGPWLGHGLTRAHIRKLDLTLYHAINNWLSRPGNEWPSDVDLPTVKQQNDRWVDRVQEDGSESLTLREARRLEGAIQRRKHGGKE